MPWKSWSASLGRSEDQVYVFRLQKVLDYRKRKEEEEQMRLSHFFQERGAAKYCLLSLQDHLVDMQARAVADKKE